MATTNLKGVAGDGNTDELKSRQLYHAYRHAKAAWDVRLYSPETFDDDLPEEVNDPLCDAHTTALNSYMLAPAGSPRQLARKLAVFRDEALQDWYRATEFVAVLSTDAERLAKSWKGDC